MIWQPNQKRLMVIEPRYSGVVNTKTKRICEIYMYKRSVSVCLSVCYSIVL